jgi:predicted permease
MVAFGGCALGVPLAFAATQGLSRLRTFSIPFLQSTTVDAAVLGFTVAITGLAGLVCGILPALQLARGNMQQRLNDAGARGTGGAAATLVRKVLAISEIAVACVLLVGAGLLIQSFGKLLDVNLGFQPKRAVSWRVDRTRSFNSLAEDNRYYDALIEKVAAIPGVEAVGLSDTLPLGRNRTWGAGARGVSYLPGEYPIAYPRIVDHRYLQTMQIPLRAGRYFEASDNAEFEKVIVINETLAKRLWPGREAIGQIMNLQGGSRVIGVVGDVRHGTLEEAGGPEMYLNFRQIDDWNAVELVVRSARPAASLGPDVRQVMKAFDPNLPATEFTTLEQIVDHAVAPRRLITHLLSAFSSLALVLAAIGLYGVIAYSVSQRTREIGIRMAVGAQRGDVLRLILREGFKMAAVGVVMGLITARFATRVLDSLLFGVTATDPLIFVTNAVILAAVALLASAVPARRAARVDPMEALRYE